MSTTNPSNKKRRTTTLLPDMGQSAKRASHNALLRLFRHLNGPVSTRSAQPSQRRLHRLLVTGFILGALSLLTSFLFVCGLLTSICGLSIGIYARRKSSSLSIMSTWTIGLSLTGLLLSLLFVTISIYR